MQEEIVSVQGLKKRYGDVQALGGISFTVRRGSLFSFLGVNGAGKSTAINILCSILQKDGGAVSVCGFDLDTQAEEIKKRVGVVFQATVLDDLLTVKDNLVTRAAFYGLRGAALRERLRRLCGLLELDDIFNRPFGKLSGGQRRRVAIAGVIVTKPEVLILDEPAAGLDPLGKKELMELLHSIHGQWCRTIVIVSHDMDEIAENCTRAAVFSEGKVALCGTPKEIFSRVKELKSYRLDVPQVTRVAMALRQRGVDIDSAVYTVADLRRALNAVRGGTC